MDKSKLMMIIIITLLVLLLGTVAGVAFFLIRSADDNDQSDWHDRQVVATPRQLSLADIVEVPIGDAITVNLAETGNRQDSARAEVVLGLDGTVDDSELDAFINAFNARINFARNIVITAFGNHTFEQIRTTEGQAALGEYIMTRLQEEFESNLIVRVGFGEWFISMGR